MIEQEPIQVFTELNNKDPLRIGVGKAETFKINEISEPNISSANYFDRQINVTGIGELTLPPDRFSITIKCKSCKDNVQDAKNSITRRVDYIVQALKNSSLKPEDYRIFQHTSHFDGMATVDSEVEAHFTDIGKCQNVSNLLAEKLGPSVSITLPHCYHSRGSLDKLRKQTGMLAIHNARQKALEMARVLHHSVGSALQVHELESQETQGTARDAEDESDLSTSIQQKIADATVVLKSKVSVCFQLASAKPKNN
ncbi:interleukin-1 receptor-associated kinase 1-binding protein 1 [Biomphalaria glabrata]|nr:interleukin-1 receptor-associated kinase 1-binding protein 1 [Biomphalaria glabrata]